MDLAELQKEAHAIAKEHGWRDEEYAFGDLIALVHSELSEALEAYRERELASSSDILRSTMPRGAYRSDDEQVECWYIPNDDSGKPELREFTEYEVTTKPEGVPSELADVVIRVADMAEWYGCPLESIEVTGVPPELPMDRPVQSFGDWIAALHFEVSTLAETWWASGGDIWAWKPYAELVVEVVNNMATHYGIDLDAAIEAKMEYNRGRSYRHGGKAL